MFKESYKNTFDRITPSEELVKSTIDKMAETKGRKKAGALWKPILAATAASVCIFSVIPACARQIPSFYNVVEYISPWLADRLVPIEKECTKAGITMEVEAIDLSGGEAEIIVSVRDAEDSAEDKISGQIDLYDSYHLSDYMQHESVIGGCSYLTYEEESGKAYFKVTVQAEEEFHADKLQFYVGEILCEMTNEEKEIPLSGLLNSVEMKRVTLSGGGGIIPSEELPDSLQNISGNADDPRPSSRVMDLADAADLPADDFTVTGMAYVDGVFRLQICMGDTSHCDRHVLVSLTDADGNEINEDHSVSWHEEVGDTRYQFYEYWFVREIPDFEGYSLHGVFHSTGGNVKGPWEVTFRLGE